MKLRAPLLATASAVVVLGALVVSVSARTFQSSDTSIRVGFALWETEGAFSRAICRLTLEGSFHSRTIQKTSNTLIGYIARASLGRCETGSATLLTETLPWHISYTGFSGSLPNIESIATKIINASWSVREALGLTCLLRSTSANPLAMTFSFPSAVIARLSGTVAAGEECGRFLSRVTSDSRPVLRPDGLSISIRLI